MDGQSSDRLQVSMGTLRNTMRCRSGTTSQAVDYKCRWGPFVRQYEPVGGRSVPRGGNEYPQKCVRELVRGPSQK